MRANLKALPEDADCRNDEAWALITFVFQQGTSQGIWTSGEEMQRSEFNDRLSDLFYSNNMNLTALLSMLNTIFHVFLPFTLQNLNQGGDLTSEKPEVSSAPPQILYLVFSAF
eukprot:5714351-Pleurochrysis_carterae.AAC.4